MFFEKKNHVRLTFALLFIALVGFSFGCAEKLGGDDENQNQEQKDPTETVTTTDEGDYKLTVVDTNDVEGAIYVSLLDGAQIEGDDNTDWHLAFEGYSIILNGGYSGPGDVAAQILDGADFDAITQAPDGTYLTDGEAETSQWGQNPARLFDQEDAWYEYDPGDPSHTVGIRDRVYILHLDGENFAKFKLTSFYDTHGTPGFYNFQWAPIDAPEGAYEVVEIVVE